MVSRAYLGPFRKAMSQTGLMPKRTKGNRPSEFWMRLTEAFADAHGKRPDRVTITDVAKLVGVAGPSAWEWKYGGKPKRPRLYELGDKLGVSVAWLETGRLPKHPVIGDPHDDMHAELEDLWSQLTMTGRYEVLRTARVWYRQQTGKEPTTAERDLEEAVEKAISALRPRTRQ